MGGKPLGPVTNLGIKVEIHHFTHLLHSSLKGILALKGAPTCGTEVETFGVSLARLLCPLGGLIDFFALPVLVLKKKPLAK